MNKNLHSVAIVFENCEDIRIPAEDIIYLGITDLLESIAKYSYGNELSFSTSCSRFCIRFTNKSNYARALEYNDITQVHLYYSEKDVADLWFYVPWGDDNSWNDKQNTVESKDYISIDIDKKI